MENNTVASAEASHPWLVIFSIPLRLLRFIAAFIICFCALLLPYRARLLWYQFITNVVHLPFRAFGVLARFIMNKTNTTNPFEE